MSQETVWVVFTVHVVPVLGERIGGLKMSLRTLAAEAETPAKRTVRNAVENAIFMLKDLMDVKPKFCTLIYL